MAGEPLRADASWPRRQIVNYDVAQYFEDLPNRQRPRPEQQETIRAGRATNVELAAPPFPP